MTKDEGEPSSRRSSAPFTSDQNKDRVELARRLFAEHEQTVRRFIRGVLPAAPEDVIEDLFQETWSRFLRPSEASPQKPKPFLLGIANNVIREHRHSMRRDREHTELPRPRDDGSGDAEDPLSQVADPSQDTERILHWRGQHQLLIEAIGKLKPLERAVYVFAEVHGSTIAQIAKCCRLSEGHVKRILREVRIYVDVFVNAREKENP